MAIAKGLDAIVLQPFLAAAGGIESLRVREIDPVHPNESGHRLIAEALESVVATRLEESYARGSQAEAEGTASF